MTPILVPNRRRTSSAAAASCTSHSRKVPALGAFIAAIIGLGLILVPSVSAAPLPAAPAPWRAEPAAPNTSEEAQRAYVESAERAEAMNEQVLVAQEREQAAERKAQAAAKLLLGKKTAASQAHARMSVAVTAKLAAERKHRAAVAAAAAYQSRVDAFADASFRGARLGSLSALLSADSPEDFLDSAATLNVIAADSQQTLADAAAANENARVARKQAGASAASAQVAAREADTAARDAATAKTQADAAQTAAHSATEHVSRRQQDLQREAARLADLRDRLTEQEREAALRAAAEARERAAARAAADQAAAEARAQAAAQQAARARANRANRTPTPPANAGQSAPVSPDESTPAATTSQAPTSTAPAPPAGDAASRAVQAALSKVGSRYAWGAAGPNAFDCSGLTSWAYAQVGITIPRTSGGQSGLPSVPMDQLRPGDLITYYSPVSHVAMYIGNGQIVHASTASKPVLVTSVYYGGPNPTAHRVTG